MTTFRRLATSSMIFLLLSSGAVISAQYAPPPGPPPQGYGGHGGWDAPPQELNEAAQRGFHDGLEGARKDYENHRQPNVNNRDEYRHPNVPKELRQDYRMGFQRGYDAGVRHMMGGGPGPR
jgi:ribosome modulation factor